MYEVSGAMLTLHDVCNINKQLYPLELEVIHHILIPIVFLIEFHNVNASVWFYSIAHLKVKFHLLPLISTRYLQGNPSS